MIGWSPACTPDLCRSDFSAMAWFFVRDTYDALKARGMERPIGIVGTYVGGTADELWSSLDALSECLDPSQPVPSGDSGLWNGMVLSRLRRIWLALSPFLSITLSLTSTSLTTLSLSLSHFRTRMPHLCSRLLHLLLSVNAQTRFLSSQQVVPLLNMTVEGFIW